MAKKYYAVRKGKKTGIFETWDQCKQSVSGYSGAEYKSFTNKKDAEAFAFGGGTANSVEISGEHKSEAIAYIDGSYLHKTKEYSYGAVIFYNDTIEKFNKKFNDPEMAQMRNVAGEIEGAMCAMRYCLEHNISSIALYYDYEGIEKWCTGVWAAKKTGTQQYKKFYDEIKQQVNISFVKVKGHSGDVYNDMADLLAKQALGI